MLNQMSGRPGGGMAGGRAAADAIGPVLDGLFRSLADPGRRAMVERLVKGPASVSELAGPLDMSLPAVLQHLAILEDSGLVSSAKAGRVRTCRLETAVLRTAEEWIADRRTTWERRLDRLGEFLARTDPAKTGRPGTARAIKTTKRRKP